MHLRASLAATAAALLLAACGSVPVAKNAPVYSPTRPGTVGSPAYGGHGGDPYSLRYGHVRSIERVSARESTSGGGAIAGALIGAVIGRQMGGTSAARDAATAVGVVGGAVIGNEVEKNRRGTTDHWRLTIDLEGGGLTTLEVPDPGGLRPGERVRVEGNRVYRL